MYFRMGLKAQKVCSRREGSNMMLVSTPKVVVALPFALGYSVSSHVFHIIVSTFREETFWRLSYQCSIMFLIQFANIMFPVHAPNFVLG